jgi:hypothetical protein
VAIDHAVEKLERTAAAGPPSLTGASLADCELALRRGDYSRAAAIAEGVLGKGTRTSSPRAQLAQGLLARALARSGNYTRASELLASLSASSAYDRLLRLECLERLGQHAEAKAAAQDLEFEPEVGVAALAIGAHASLALREVRPFSKRSPMNWACATPLARSSADCGPFRVTSRYAKVVSRMRSPSQRTRWLSQTATTMRCSLHKLTRASGPHAASREILEGRANIMPRRWLQRSAQVTSGGYLHSS